MKLICYLLAETKIVQYKAKARAAFIVKDFEFTDESRRVDLLIYKIGACMCFPYLSLDLIANK